MKHPVVVAAAAGFLGWMIGVQFGEYGLPFCLAILCAIFGHLIDRLERAHDKLWCEVHGRDWADDD